LYERFLKIHEILNDYKGSETAGLDSALVTSKIAFIRFNLFKSTLYLNTGVKDANIIEDYHWKLIGKQAFLTSTLDKLVSITLKSLQLIQND